MVKEYISDLFNTYAKNGGRIFLLRFRASINSNHVHAHERQITITPSEKNTSTIYQLIEWSKTDQARLSSLVAVTVKAANGVWGRAGTHCGLGGRNSPRETRHKLFSIDGGARPERDSFVKRIRGLRRNIIIDDPRISKMFRRSNIFRTRDILDGARDLLERVLERGFSSQFLTFVQTTTTVEQTWNRLNPELYSRVYTTTEVRLTKSA